ncbi:MAG: tail fiber domain-containing protein, partial [Candidatus Margulisiibacteriota bacterium]
ALFFFTKGNGGAIGADGAGMVITHIGNVGIGTTAPISAKLQVLSPGNLCNLAVSGNSSSFTGTDIYIARSSTGTGVGNGAAIQFDNGSAVTHNVLIQQGAGNFQIFNNSTGAWTERLKIGVTGNVGIGTTGPGAKLDVAGNINLGTSSAAGAITITGIIGSIDQFSIKNNIGNYLKFTADSNPNTAFFVMNNLGNVGVGLTNPLTKLTVNADNWYAAGGESSMLLSQTSATAVAEIFSKAENTNGLAGMGFRTVWGGGDGLATRMYIDHTGNVGIGTTAPGYKLQVGAAGDGSEARANAWNSLSDARLKTNLVKLTGAMEKIDLLNGYYFNWKQGVDKKKQVGVIAQEIEKVLPEVVSEGGDGYKSVEYSKLAPLFIEAFKELKAENEKLQAENGSIKRRLEMLEKR